ncbi:MAG: hypothetical protein ACI828_001799 [Flavobacteriales bacterium]|jgi:hypothetical protein
MKEILRYITAIYVLFLFVECTAGDKAIEEVMEEIERGAVFRNIDYNNIVFAINDADSAYSIVLEEQDI